MNCHFPDLKSRRAAALILLAALTGSATVVSTPQAASLIDCSTVPLGTPADGATSCFSFTSPGGGFAGLFRDGAPGAEVGVIMMHGRGATPNSLVVREMRTTLANAGYATLSIQNPIPADANNNGTLTDFSDYVADVQGPNTVFPETFARISEAIAFMAGQSIERIVIGGFSLGSRLALAHVARGQQTGDLPIVGYIGVGINGNSIDPLNHLFTLDGIGVPVLDIYGDADPDAAPTAPSRLLAYGGNPDDYTQIALNCRVDIVGNDCHQLRGGLRGAEDRPFEIAVNDWASSFAPLISIHAPDDWSAIIPALGFVVWRLRRSARG
jgi:dienelactone hydrolase